jgi:uncharacterized protein (TIGR04255 family)
MALPVSLEREPLVEAIFEIRFGGTPQLADLLPGLLFGQLDPKPKMHRQPAADIPQPIRASDPNLTFAALIRLEFEHFNYLIGDRNVVIGCKLPYPKWPAFKSQILQLTSLMAEVGVEGDVERYSVKYVNLISAPDFKEQIAKVDMELRLGELDVVESHFNLQVHHRENEIIHILTVITGANGKRSDGSSTYGIVVDVDSIQNVEPISYKNFVDGLEHRLEALRQANKVKFFGCLKQEAIEEMGPVYG